MKTGRFKQHQVKNYRNYVWHSILLYLLISFDMYTHHMTITFKLKHQFSNAYKVTTMFGHTGKEFDVMTINMGPGLII